jgi:two-component system chemotaxis response regulator CheB
MRYDIVVVGCSWGGLVALERLLPSLPPEVTAPVVIAQHRSTAVSALASLLSRFTTRPVHEADDKQPIAPGSVYLAPPGYHLLVERGRLALSTEGPVRHSRPSIDVLFESAADAYGSGVIGVVLTGANEDGATGLATVVDRGGRAIVQDPD